MQISSKYPICNFCKKPITTRSDLVVFRPLLSKPLEDAKGFFVYTTHFKCLSEKSIKNSRFHFYNSMSEGEIEKTIKQAYFMFYVSDFTLGIFIIVTLGSFNLNILPMIIIGVTLLFIVALIFYKNYTNLKRTKNLH